MKLDIGGNETIQAPVEALWKAGFFRLRGILVGSLAYQCYAGPLGIRLTAASVRTDDADFAQFWGVSENIGESMEHPLNCAADDRSDIPRGAGHQRSVRHVTIPYQERLQGRVPDTQSRQRRSHRQAGENEGSGRRRRATAAASGISHPSARTLRDAVWRRRPRHAPEGRALRRALVRCASHKAWSRSFGRSRDPIPPRTHNALHLLPR